MLISDNLVGCKRKIIAVIEKYGTVFKASDAVLGSFCVKHNCKRHVELFSYILQHVNCFQMLGMRSVRKIEPCNIHSRPDHGGQSLLIAACGANRANNFCFSHLYQIL